jgi:two-component system, OmpR family, KDP operon response regulator KdpE
MTASHHPSVLVIDDEVQIQRLIRVALEANGFKVYQSETGEAGLARAAMDHPDMVILDLGLPDADGVTILKKLREWSQVPVLILTVRSGESDIIACLEAGADDYLVKPFRPGELLARIRTALRHAQKADPEVPVIVGPLFIDLQSMTVKRNGQLVKLTEKEYALLALLVRNAGRLMTHHYILEQVWGPTFADETQYTRVYISQLRKKLEEDPTNPRVIITESGIGYRFVADTPGGQGPATST